MRLNQIKKNIYYLIINLKLLNVDYPIKTILVRTNMFIIP